MAFWTNLLNQLFLPGKPILGSTGMALRDNIIAMGEGATGAPRVQPKAIVGFAGRSAIVSNFVCFLQPYPVERVRVASFISVGTSTAATFRVSASSDGGATWGAYSTLATLPNDAPADSAFVETEIDLLTGVFSAIATGTIGCVRTAGVLSVAAGTNALQFNMNSGAGAHTVYCIGTGT